MKLSNKKISIIFFVIWVCLILYTLYDNYFAAKNSLGNSLILQESRFARGMFIDISILSILIAIWIMFYSKHKYKNMFAFLTIFVGSFAVLPFLSIYFWNKDNE